jgi:uncharacterized membrane protein
MPVLISENKRGTKAFSRSKELVKGKSVLDKIIGLALIGLLVSFVTDPLLESDLMVVKLVAFFIIFLTSALGGVLTFLIYEKLVKIERKGKEAKENYSESLASAESY